MKKILFAAILLASNVFAIAPETGQTEPEQNVTPVVASAVEIEIRVSPKDRVVNILMGGLIGAFVTEVSTYCTRKLGFSARTSGIITGILVISSVLPVPIVRNIRIKKKILQDKIAKSASKLNVDTGTVPVAA